MVTDMEDVEDVLECPECGHDRDTCALCLDGGCGACDCGCECTYLIPSD